VYQLPRPRKESCVIERLPPEILREIFIHTFDGSLVPVALFLVNRRWSEIACNTAVLRSVIHIGRSYFYHRIYTENEIPVFCDSSAGLTDAIARLGNAKFELVIEWIPDDLVLKDLPLEHRCRRLRLLCSIPQVSILQLPRMHTLEELALELQGSLDERQTESQRLLQHLEVTSPSLTRLEMFGVLPSILHHTPRLLRRLKSFELVTNTFMVHPEEVGRLMENLINVKEFTWESMSHPGEPIDVLPPLVESVRLFRLTQIPQQALDHIVELVIRYDDYDFHPPSGPLLHFPVLQRLEMRRSWADLPRIRVPPLSHLTLDFPQETKGQVRKLIPEIQVKTKALSISLHLFDSSLHLLLSGIWSDIEEFHLECVDAREVVGNGLSRILAGDRKTEPLCPNLWCFTVLFHSSVDKSPVPSSATLKTLQGFIDKREKRGIGGLVRVRCGWKDEDVHHNWRYYHPRVVKTWIDIL
jgi:F-box-like